jgi:hypothetical protein
VLICEQTNNNFRNYDAEYMQVFLKPRIAVSPCTHMEQQQQQQQQQQQRQQQQLTDRFPSQVFGVTLSARVFQRNVLFKRQMAKNAAGSAHLLDAPGIAWAM